MQGLQMELRASCVLTKYNTIKLHPQPQTRLGTTALHEEVGRAILFAVSGNHTGSGEVFNDFI